MTRTPTPLVLITVLLTGVVLGMIAERAGPSVSAQATRTNDARAAGTLAEVPAPPPAPAPASATATTTATRTTAATTAPTPANPPKPPAASPLTSTTVTTPRDEDDDPYRELDQQYEQFKVINRTFELAARAVSPAVVHIVARKTDAGDTSHRHYEETGSGVIVRSEEDPKSRCVLTNNHVIDGASPGEVNVYLRDGRVIHPKRIWSDNKADVAVLDLGVANLPAARLGNSDEAPVGTWVLALGSPFGLTHSVSHGIISARGRHEQELQEEGVENQDFLQTDAAINPGNSGGPLVNLKGEVIGVNTAIASHHGGSEGVGFSIPINLARWAMTQLVRTGRVSRGAMGVDLADIKPEQAQEIGLKRPRGAWVQKVHPESPAEQAGVIKGDIILNFNGVEVVDLNHLINLVSMAPIGVSADLVLWRDRAPVRLRVTVADRDRVLANLEPVVLAPTDREPAGAQQHKARPTPTVPGSTAVAPTPAADLGLDLASVKDAADAGALGLPGTARGVAVVAVAPTSPLAAHLRRLDVIQAIDGRAVRTVDEVVRALASRLKRGPLELTLQRRAGGGFQRQSVRVP